MFSIKFDKKRNLLTITFRDHFDIQQGELLCKRLEDCLSKVKKNFMVLTDLSDLDSFDNSAQQYIQQTMTICNAYGVSKIFRIIPDEAKDMGFNIMSIFHYSKHVKIHTYKTFEEAKYYIRINTNITFLEKILAALSILKIKTADISEHAVFRVLVIVCGFVVLIILRQTFKAFGISLGYLYITLIALAGFWFEIKGGLAAALIAFIVFVAEVNLFNAWADRDIVAKTILLRFMIYFLSGVVIGYLAKSEKKIQKKLEFLAGHDELTGALNLKFTLMLLKKEFERSKRYKENFTIAIVDIDNFKNINDTRGHLVGNEALKAFSDIIKNSLRGTDMIGRYGGDEFLLMLPESTCEQGASILIRIKTVLSTIKITSPFLLDKSHVSLTFSAGLAAYSSDNTPSVNSLIDNADKALYQAKKEGKDKLSIYQNIASS